MAVRAQTVSADNLAAELPERQYRTLWGDVWLRFRRHTLAIVGMFVLAILVLGCSRRSGHLYGGPGVQFYRR